MLTLTAPTTAPTLASLTVELAGPLSARRDLPDVASLDRAIGRVLPERSPHSERALRQNLNGHLHNYLTRLRPPAPWGFAGPRFDLGLGPMPLVWTSSDGRVLADLMHTGPPWQLRAEATGAQVAEFLADRVDQFGTQLVGVRHLSTLRPLDSLLVTPTGRSVPLIDTPYHCMENDRG